jgi:aspartyl aminopeptidase
VDRGVNDNLKFNQETEFVPILGMIDAELNSEENKARAEDASRGKNTYKASSVQDNHHPVFLSILSEELSVAPEDIHDFEL